MPTQLKTTAKITLLIIFASILGGYSVFATKNLIAGPIIEIKEPKDGQTLTESLLSVNGNIKNSAFVSLNDAPITVNEEGEFNERIILAPGYNIIKVKVRDRFGREEVKLLELMYNL